MKPLLVAFIAVSWGSAAAAEVPVIAGSYSVSYRLELPHLERWAVGKTATVCLPAKAAMLPILSANTPFAACRVETTKRAGSELRYGIVCPGRDSARAQAIYRFTEKGFTARIDMVMGAKNMTMTEVQSGARTGACAIASIGRD